MKLPPHILLTSLPLPGQTKSPISIRVDVIVLVEHAKIQLEEQPAPGVKVTKSGPSLPAGAATQGTVLHIAGGGKVFVDESVEEVHAAIKRAARGGLFR